MYNNFIVKFESIDFETIKDHPNILIAASFWEEERYKAAQTFYRYLRELDDLIDCHKSLHTTIKEKDRKYFMDKVDSWISSIEAQTEKTTSVNELIRTIKKFRLPLWPLEDFARSMIYDINHSGFRTLNDFIEYSQGASVAPASIFLHLCGLRSRDHEYLIPAFDVKKAATPCAMFSYIVHIIRDFRKDQENNLNCFAHDILTRNGLNAEKVREIATGKAIPEEFRNVIREYCDLADKYRRLTHETIHTLGKHVEPPYLLSLHIIFNLYLMVYERIDCETGSFTSPELNPTPGEIKQRVFETITGYMSA
ncbi:MAG: squalene/phytoene synthase family protein [Bacteroidales bacterium]|nr:squalene/phytoene synthase family protein [Bacteroidales bacterium]